MRWMVNGAVALFVLFSGAQQIAGLWLIGSLPERSAPQQTVTSEVEDTQVFRAYSLFGESPTQAATTTPDVAPLTSFGLVLKGVVAIKESGLAFIGVQGKPEDLFAFGQEVVPGIKLAAVHPDRVVLLYNGRLETLMLEGSEAVAGIEIVTAVATQVAQAVQLTSTIGRSVSVGTAIPSVGRVSAGAGTAQKPIVVSRTTLRAHVQTPQELLSQAVLVPDSSGGFLLKEIQSGSLIEKFGLRAGDVVRSANGQPLTYADDIRRVYQQLADATQLKLELYRDGKPAELHYQLQ